MADSTKPIQTSYEAEPDPRSPDTPPVLERKLDPTERKLENLQKNTERTTGEAEREGRAKVDTVRDTREELERLEELHRNDPFTAQEEQPEQPKKEMPKAEMWYDPRTWTPEHRTKATQIALIGTGVVGGLLLLKWMWKGMKKGGEIVKEKTASAFGYLKFATLAAILTIGGFFGYRALTKVNRLLQVEKQIEQLSKQMGNASEEAKRELEKQIAPLKQEAERLRKEKGTNGPQSPSSNAQENEKSRKIELTKEQKEIISKGKRGMIAGAIVHLYEDPEWGIGNPSKATQISDAIQSNATMTIAEALSRTLQTDGKLDVSIPPSFKIDEDDRESRTKASEMLITFCADQKGKVARLLSERRGISIEDATQEIMDMELGTFIETVVSSYSFIPELAEAVLKSNGDAASAIDNLKEQFLQDNAALREAVEGLIPTLGLSDEELSEFSTAKLLSLLAKESAENGSVKTRLSTMSPHQDTVEEKVLRSILERITSKDDDTATFMIPCFQDIFPEKEVGVSEQEFIQRYLESRMSVGQAIRFFLYKEMIKNGNSAGLVMMQIEALKLIADSDMSFLNYKKNHAIVRIMESLLQKESSMLVAEYKKLGLKVPQEVFDAAKLSLGVVFKVGAAGYMTYIREKLGTGWAIASEHPDIAMGIGAFLVTRTVTSTMMHSTINAAERAIIELGMKGGAAADLIEPELGGRILRSRLARIPLLGRGETLQKWMAARRVLRQANLPTATVQTGKNIAAGFNAIRNSSLIQDTASGAPLIENISRNSSLAGEAMDTITRAGSATEVAQAAAQEFKTFDQLKDAIDVAKAAKDNNRLAQLLKNPLLQETAAAGDDYAKMLTRLQKFCTVGKWAGRGVAVLGPLIDGYMMWENGKAIEEAEKNKNNDLVEVLKQKQANLLRNAAVNGALIAVTGPVLGIALPLTVAASLYTQAVFDSMVTWKRSATDWLSTSPKDLRAKMEEFKTGHIDIGQRAGYGYSPLYSAWRWGTSWTSKSKEKNTQEDAAQLEGVESVNANVRQELLMSYFLQTQLPQIVGETPEQYKERITPLLRDRMIYMKRFTNGTYDASILGERFFEQAGSYSDLMNIRRDLKSKGQPLQINTGSDGDKRLDLQSLDYVMNDDLKNNDTANMSFLKTMHQFEEQQKLLPGALQDFIQLADQ